MKAEKYGTWMEQIRYRVGWLSPSKIPHEQNERCQTCRYHRLPDRGGVRCVKGEFSTLSRAWCRMYRAN